MAKDIKIPEFKVFEPLGLSFAKRKQIITPEDFTLVISEKHNDKNGKWFEVTFEMIGDSIELQSAFATYFILNDIEVDEKLKAFVLKSVYPFIRSYVFEITKSSMSAGILLPVVNIDMAFKDDMVEMKVVK